MEDIENEQLNILKIVLEHRADEHIDDDTPCKTKAGSTVGKRLDVRYIADDFIDDDEQLSSP